MALFSGGDDIRANTKWTFRAAARLPNATHMHFPKGKHELLMETDDIRQSLIDAALNLADDAWERGFTPH